MAQIILKPEEDLYVNYDLWRSGSKTVLFVTGLSGSGKSTITRYINTKYGGKEGKCVYVSLDIFFQIKYYRDSVKLQNPDNIALNQFLIDFAREYGYGDIDSDDPTWFLASSKMRTTPYSMMVKDVVQYVLTKRRDIRVILEGVQVFDVDDLYEIVEGFPIVIKAVPTFEAIKRALKRNYNAPLLPAVIKDFRANGGGTLSWYLRSRKRLDVLIDRINQSVDSSKIQKIKSYQFPM